MTLNRLSTLALAASTALATLSLSPARADTGSTPPSSTPAKRQAQAAADWVQASSKHNGSGIRLRYIVPGHLQPGQVAQVQLQFSGVTTDGATVELRAPQGATLTRSDGTALSTVQLPRGETTTLALQLTPAADGMQSIDVFSHQAGRGSAQSVPLKVGSGAPALKASGTPMTTPEGERVISLPSTPAR